MAVYTWSQLSGAGVLNTEEFNPTDEENPLVELKITFPVM